MSTLILENTELSEILSIKKAVIQNGQRLQTITYEIKDPFGKLSGTVIN